jgi:hypothetical protein
VRVFGPFATASAVRTTLSDLHRVVPLRDCPDTVMNHRSRPCLKHQIGLCAAPCVGLIDEAAYAELVERAVRVLSGDTRELEASSTSACAPPPERWSSSAPRPGATASPRCGARSSGQGVRPRDRVRRDVLGLARRRRRRWCTACLPRRASGESRAHLFQSELPDEELCTACSPRFYAGGGASVRRDRAARAPADRELLEHASGRTWRSAARERRAPAHARPGRRERAQRARAQRAGGASEAAALEELSAHARARSGRPR